MSRIDTIDIEDILFESLAEEQEDSGMFGDMDILLKDKDLDLDLIENVSDLSSTNAVRDIFSDVRKEVRTNIVKILPTFTDGLDETQKEKLNQYILTEEDLDEIILASMVESNESEIEVAENE